MDKTRKEGTPFPFFSKNSSLHPSPKILDPQNSKISSIPFIWHQFHRKTRLACRVMAVFSFTLFPKITTSSEKSVHATKGKSPYFCQIRFVSLLVWFHGRWCRPPQAPGSRHLSAGASRQARHKAADARHQAAGASPGLL